MLSRFLRSGLFYFALVGVLGLVFWFTARTDNLVRVLLPNVILILLIAALWRSLRRPARPNPGDGGRVAEVHETSGEQIPSDQLHGEKPVMIVHGGDKKLSGDNQLGGLPRSKLFYALVVIVGGLTFWFTWQSLQHR